MIVTTTPGVEGHPIQEYKGVVFGEVIAGVNFVKDVMAGFSNFFGGRSGTYEEELIPMFEEQNPGVTVKGTYDSSGKLQTQIEEGLEADVFMSAATQQMDALTEEGFIDGDSVKDLLENQIVLVTSAENELGLAEFTDITKAATIAIGDPASVPA